MKRSLIRLGMIGFDGANGLDIVGPLRRIGSWVRILPLAAIPTLAALAVVAFAAEPTSIPATAVYTANGRLIFPDNYREWIFLTSGLDMSYRKKAGVEGHSMFDNVFVDPTAYHEFQRTGTWPDGTVLVMEMRGAAEKGSINEHGRFQSTQFIGAEAHIKDTRRFAGGWAFFAFDDSAPAAQIPTTADCYACHQQHAAVDTTFVQFYPTLLPLAVQKGTLSPGYRP